MRESTRYLLALATAWPLLFFVIFVFFVISVFMSAPHMGFTADGGFEVPTDFLVMMALNAFTSFLTLGLMVFYIVHVVKNEELEQGIKVLWVLGLLFATVFIMPVYFYLYFWREEAISSSRYGLPQG
jgi:hypothetical protein